MAEKNSLWKNIRNKAKQNRASGATPKKPTTEMLRQERKIKASKAEGGPVKRGFLEEREFKKEYDKYADATGNASNPYDVEHYYNYSKLYDETGGIMPHLSEGHLPSEYKELGHPNLYIEGKNTKTFAQGGPTKPIYISDPNKFKKAEQSYKDSSDVYNAVQYLNTNIPIATNALMASDSWDAPVVKKSEAVSKKSGIVPTKTGKRIPQAYSVNTGSKDYYDQLYLKKPTPVVYSPKLPTVEKLHSTINTEKLNPLGFTNINQQEELHLRDFPKQKAYINRGANSGFDANGNPLVSEYNLGKGQGWVKSTPEELNQFEEIKATGGYYPTQGPPKALFKGYANGGFVSDDDKNKNVAVRDNTNTSFRTLEDKMNSAENDYYNRLQAEKDRNLLEERRLTLKKRLNEITTSSNGVSYDKGTPGERVSLMKSLAAIDSELNTNSLEKQYKTLNKSGQLVLKAGKYIFPQAAPAFNAIDTGLDVQQYVTNPNIKNATSLQMDMMSPYKITTQTGKQFKPFGVIGDIYDTYNIVNEKANGGYTNPYNQYQKDPHYQYEVGGKVWKNIAAGAYGVGEGILDTVTGGATDQLTDKGFEALTKAGNKNIDLNNPDDVKFLKTQQKVKGYSNTAGAIGTGIFTGNVQGAVKQGTKGLNTAFQATDGMSDSFKQWSQGITGVVGVASGFASGLNSDSFNTTQQATQAAEKAGTGVKTFGQKVSKAAPFANQALGMIGGGQQPLWQQGDDRQDYLNSPEQLGLKKQQNQNYINQGLNFSQGGNITNNSLNLRNTMRNKRFAKGGTFDQHGINFIPESAGLHHQSAYGGVPIGPDALAEGGEIKMDTGDGGQYIVSDQVDGAETQKDFTFSKGGKYKELNRTLADGMKQDLNKYTFGSLATSDRVKGDLRRPNDSYGKNTIEQIKNKWQQKTEFARQRSQQEQAIAQLEENKRLAEEEYIAAYGGKINPKKYPGLNYAKGGIHIKPENKGKFTASAKAAGHSVQEHAKAVLNNPNATPLQKKRANFARNAAKWKHADGGYVHNQMIQPMLAEGGPIYGDPASPYTYAYGGMYGDPYYRGGEIDYTNDMYSMYASGGPMVGNAPQAFKGLAAQNRGGMLMTYAGGGALYEPGYKKYVDNFTYPDGGMMPQEQQMQQQGGQDQMMQMVQQVEQALMQGAQPEQVMQQLVQSGVPPEQAQQIIQAAMQDMQSQQQQQPMQGQEQMMPQGMADGGMMPQQSGAATKIAEALQQGANPQQVLQQLIDDGMPQDQAMSMVQAVMGQLKTQMQQPQMAPQQSMMVNGGMVQYGNGGGKHLWNMITDPTYRSTYRNIMQANGYPTKRQLRERDNFNQDYWDKNNGSQEQEMFPESWQTTAAGLAQAVPGIAGAAFSFGKLKDRKLKPALAQSVTVDYTPERVALQEEGRRGISTALDAMRRTAPTSGSYMGNAREAMLRGNKVIGAQISKSWQDQKNEQAKYDFETGKINADTRNKVNELNEGMYQNAMEQGFRSSQDAVDKVANYYTGKETRDMQRWQAQNTDTTNYTYHKNPATGIVEKVYVKDGKFYDMSGNPVD